MAARSGLLTAWNRADELRWTSSTRNRGRGGRGAVEAGGAWCGSKTPEQSLLRITDIATSRSADIRRGAIVVATTPSVAGWQHPLELGATSWCTRPTKYINGHSDVVGGAVIAKTPELAEQARLVGQLPRSHRVGVRQLPHAARLRTLHVAPAANTAATAQAVAEYLAKQKQVKRVYYPGLASHSGTRHRPGRQPGGFGAIVTLEVAGGLDGARRFSEALELFSLAESLGGVESLVAHPATMTHAAMAPEARAAAGLVDGLLRLSIGIESTEDLLRDLANGVKSLG
jgi:cystathionine gamma-synthase